MESVLKTVSALIQTMRPRQWTKNVLFVFPAIVFSGHLFEVDLFLRVVVCCILMILMSGSIYIVNDLADVESDRLHPVKRSRPIAAGLVSTSIAKAVVFVLPLFVLAIGYRFDQELTLVLFVYFVIQIAYSIYLKHIVVLDIIVVSVGFVMRLMAGGIVIDVSVSPWLYSSAGLLALFLVIGKRRQELVMLGEKAAETRAIFQSYNLSLLDDMLRIVMTSTMITYILYIVESNTLVRYGENLGLLTVPIVIYGLFRYLYLIHVRLEGGAPDEVLLTDRPLQATLVCAALVYFVILYVL